MLRALRGLGYAALLLTFFEACSGDESSTPSPPGGPASIAITAIALGHGFVGDGNGASSILACDYTIGVNVQTTNWTLTSPGRCGGALQCGQLRVTLLDGMNNELKQVMAAGNGVALDARAALSAVPPSALFPYSIRAELIEDSGKPYVELDGGDGSAQQDFEMALPDPTSCSSAGTAGGGGAPIMNTAGAAGDHAIGGAGGAGGDHAANDSAGAAGAAPGEASGGTSAAPEL